MRASANVVIALMLFSFLVINTHSCFGIKGRPPRGGGHPAAAGRHERRPRPDRREGSFYAGVLTGVTGEQDSFYAGVLTGVSEMVAALLSRASNQ